MKNLFEEFKIYENLWESEAATEEKAEATEVNPTVEELIKKYKLPASTEAALAKYREPFSIDYDEMIDEWEEDAWDYRAGNHTTITRSNHLDAFTYKVDADEVFDKLIYEFLEEYPVLNQLEDTIKRLKKEYRYSDYASRMEPVLTKLVNEYIELAKFDETADIDYDLEELSYIYVADNLEDFFELYYDVFQEDFKEEAVNSQY